MGIESSAFGRITLTGTDADKFRRQVRHGKPKAAAVKSLERGRKLVKEFNRSGSVKLRIKAVRD